MGKILNFIKENRTLVIIAAAVIVLAIIILVLIKLISRKRKYKALFKNIEKIKESLSLIPIEAKLEKLRQVGLNNISYGQLYNEYKSRYDSISSGINEKYDLEIKYAKEQYNAKEYKKLNNTLNLLQQALLDYKDQLDLLNGNISLCIKDDEELREVQRTLESRVSFIRTELIEKGLNLKFMANDLNKFYEDIDHGYEIFNDFILRGNYVDAKEIITKLDAKVKNLEANYKNLIEYGTLVSITLPTKINGVIATYNNMNKEEYPMGRIPVSDTIASCKNQWIDIINRLRTLKFDQIDSTLNDINLRIEKLDKQLEAERFARKSYEELFESVYNRAIELDRKYISSIKRTDNIDKMYESNKEREDMNSNLHVQSQKMYLTRSALDSLNLGSQPYSSRLKKLQELKDQIGEFEKTMADSKVNYDSLELDKKNCEKILLECSFTLRNVEISLRNSKFETLITRYSEDFSRSFSLITLINTVLNTQPIDIDRANKLAIQLQDITASTSELVSKELQTAIKAEKLIIYANNYRPFNPSLARDIARAEILFEDGRYAESVDAALLTMNSIPIPLEIIQ